MSPPTCPLTGTEVLDEYFLENRARLLEVAAFLDRVDRARASEAAHEDLRYLAFRDAVGILAGGDDDRARRVHLCFTDPTTEPLASAAGLKGAAGAWMGGRP